MSHAEPVAQTSWQSRLCRCQFSHSKLAVGEPSTGAQLAGAKVLSGMDPSAEAGMMNPRGSCCNDSADMEGRTGRRERL